ncbi:MAG: V-type ATP synthase subunit A, partial [Candidatus Poribacteria bacterium]
FWGLDPELAGARHFPAINWIDSYSEYIEDLAPWWIENFGIHWTELRTRFTEILQIEQRLQQVVKLVGPDALPDSERLILEVARIIKIAFLQQNALSEDDAYCVTMKQIKMAQAILHFYDRAKAIIDKGAPIFTITGLNVVQDILRMKSRIPNDKIEEFDDLMATIDEQMDELEERYK